MTIIFRLKDGTVREKECDWEEALQTLTGYWADERARAKCRGFEVLP